jgi:hypothetical protein
MLTYKIGDLDNWTDTNALEILAGNASTIKFDVITDKSCGVYISFDREAETPEALFIGKVDGFSSFSVEVGGSCVILVDPIDGVQGSSSIRTNHRVNRVNETPEESFSRYVQRQTVDPHVAQMMKVMKRNNEATQRQFAQMQKDAADNYRSSEPVLIDTGDNPPAIASSSPSATDTEVLPDA